MKSEDLKNAENQNPQNSFNPLNPTLNRDIYNNNINSITNPSQNINKSTTPNYNLQNMNSSNIDLSKSNFETQMKPKQDNPINESSNNIKQNIQDQSNQNIVYNNNILNPELNSFNSVPRNHFGAMDPLGNNLNFNPANNFSGLKQNIGINENFPQKNDEIRNNSNPEKNNSSMKGFGGIKNCNINTDLNEVNTNLNQNSQNISSQLEITKEKIIDHKINDQLTKNKELNLSENPQELSSSNISKELRDNLRLQEQKISAPYIESQNNESVNLPLTNNNQNLGITSQGSDKSNSEVLSELSKDNNENRKYLENRNNFREISMKDLKDPPPGINYKANDSSIGNLVKLENSWATQIRNNAKLDPRNERIVMEHLVELTNDSVKMKNLIDDIFCTLNNNSNELSAIEFKEFYDLTGKGMKAPQLDSSYIMSEFNSISKTKFGFVTKLEMQQYVTRLYKSIINFLSKNINYRQLSTST